MTNEELARLDRWAAKAMGWALASNGEWVEGDPESPTDFPMYCTSESGLEDPEGVWEIWRPTRNPDQAHMVRREMERQGWDCLFIYDAMTRNYGVMFSKFLPSNSGQTTYLQEECECLTILRAAYAAKQVEREKMGESEI